MSAGRVVLILVVLGALYVWQNQHELRYWWNMQSGTAQVSSAITVYSARGCDPCEQALALLQGTGRPVQVRHIDEDDIARAEFADAGGGAMPLIVDGTRQMRGFNPELLSGWYLERERTAARLDRAGVYRAGDARLPVLFGTSWCPYCAQARKYFEAHGIAFRDLDIEHDAEARRQYNALGLSGIPVMVYEDMIWSGFSAQGMDEKRKWVGNGRG